MTTSTFATLRDMGVSIELLDAEGKRLNEAVDYEPMSVADAIGYAKQIAEQDERVVQVVVSVDRGDDFLFDAWLEIWSAERSADGRWSW